MIEVQEIGNKEIEELLKRVGYGHLGCSRNNHPYVVPINYAYEEGLIYIYTTEGKKTEMIAANSEVCLQVEEVESNKSWESVIVIGDAEHITNEAERERALELVLQVNPTLTPALSVRWMDSWVRENIEVVYRIRPRITSGRKAIDRKTQRDALLASQKKSTIY